jgi:hypothetical protein
LIIRAFSLYHYLDKVNMRSSLRFLYALIRNFADKNENNSLKILILALYE